MNRPLRACCRLAASVVALIPQAVWPEGAVKLLDCTIVRVCDAAGVCRAGDGDASFRMEPISLEAGGVGRYTIRYGDTEADMDAMSEVGPFIWTVGRERHSLIVSSETQWLWHELVPEPALETKVRFLECTFQR